MENVFDQLAKLNIDCEIDCVLIRGCLRVLEEKNFITSSDLNELYECFHNVKSGLLVSAEFRECVKRVRERYNR